MATNSYNSKEAIEIYGMTEEQATLAQEAYANRNTEVGYKAFYELLKLTVDNHLSDEVIPDLDTEFAWDSRLSDAINRYAIAENRMDLYEES
jgi:hypothetical protein